MNCEVCGIPMKPSTYGVCQKSARCAKEYNARWNTAHPGRQRKAGVWTECKLCGSRIPKTNIFGICSQTCQSVYDWAFNLRSEYGMTIDDYERMLGEQGGLCAICGREPGQTRFHVDHDHRCCPGRKTCGNCIRGLLCGACNKNLGVVENHEFVQRASEYLSARMSAGGSLNGT